MGHPFLEYALDYWLLHTRNFEEGKSRTWNLWKQMIRGSQGLVRTPWSLAEFHDRAPIVYQWIDKHDHCAVFLQLVSISALDVAERIDLICRYAKLGCLDRINILISLIDTEEELSYGLPHAAWGGHLEVVQRLLDAKADVNATNGVCSQTALQAAAERCHLQCVKGILRLLNYLE